MKGKEFSYETPKFEVIKIEVESAILSASSGNVENPVEGEESDW
jgi:hypothetical protein